MSQESASNGKTPSVMRYSRIQSILERDPASKAMLGPKNQEMVKRNGEKFYFSMGVITVTNELHSRGFDAYSVSPPTVIGVAFDVLRSTAVAESKSKEPAKQGIKLERKARKAKVRAKRTEPAKEPPKEPKRKRGRKPKLKIEQKTDQVPSSAPVLASTPPFTPPPTPPPTPTPTPTPTVPSAPSIVASTCSPAPSAAPIQASALTEADKPSVVPASKPAIVYYAYGSALSLVASAFNILQVADMSPGSEERLEALGKVIAMLQPLSSVGVQMPQNLLQDLKHVQAAARHKS